MPFTRRRAISSLLKGAAAIAAAPAITRRARADDRLDRTPSQVEGPFYPDDRPNLTADLIHRAGGTAEGAGLTLSGEIRDRRAQLVAGAKIEIWQADHRGIYRHPRDRRFEGVDQHFHGHGVATTDHEGRFEFLTLVPVPYTGRPPHIHVRISGEGLRSLTTQLYLAGHPQNERKGIGEWLFFPDKDRLLISPQTREDGHSEAAFNFVV